MTDSIRPSTNMLLVTSEENGMKLLRFLERRLAESASQSMLHKWIRTGQVRINGKRSKPFQLLTHNDEVRLPPFIPTAHQPETLDIAIPLERLAKADIPVLSTHNGILAIHKPAGLPTQSGTSHTRSIASLFKDAWAEAAYSPAPAHRLDLQTSGVLLAGLDHRTQRMLQESFSKEGSIIKDYLAWVDGEWPEKAPCLMADYLIKAKDSEEVHALPGGLTLTPESLVYRKDIDESSADPIDLGSILKNIASPMGSSAGHGGRALATVVPIFSLKHKQDSSTILSGAIWRTLLLVRLITGRTHQIRVQLSSRGFPIIGDSRYGGRAFNHMLLHAWRVGIPAGLDKMHTGTLNSTAFANEPLSRLEETPVFLSALPPWPAEYIPAEEYLLAAVSQLDKAITTWNIPV